MLPDSKSPPGQIRSFFKRVTNGTKKVLNRGDRAPISRTHSPLPQTPPGDSPPQHVSSSEPILAPPSQTPSRSRQPTTSPKPAIVTSLLAAESDQTAKAESSLALTAKKAGANAWTGLKPALQALKECSVAFPPLQAAVGGLLVLADVVEVSDTVSHALTHH